MVTVVNKTVTPVAWGTIIRKILNHKHQVLNKRKKKLILFIQAPMLKTQMRKK